MRTSIITALALYFSCMTLQAQQKTTMVSSDPAKDPREHCLMATGADWARLGIDQEQILRVNTIQATCMQDCVAARESGQGITSVMDRHIAELRTVLTPDQFESWNKWCNEKISTKATPQKSAQPVQ